MKELKVLMVCLGNICRSPLAEGILRHKAAEQNIKMEVASAGTAGYHVGEAPDRRSVLKAKEKGLDISHLRGRQFVQEDFYRFDHILVMDSSNKEDVLSLARSEEDRKKVSMILNYVHPDEDLPVPDPYNGGDQGFEHVYLLLDEACEIFLQEIT